MSGSNDKNLHQNNVEVNKVMFIILSVLAATFVIVIVFLLKNSVSTGVVLPDNLKKSGIVTIEMEIKDKGTARFDLRNDLVPKTVKTFLTKILQGYYTGRSFYRVDNYLLCAGSVDNKEGIDFDKGVKLDISDQLTVEKYTIAMAKNVDSSYSSTKIFFISKVTSESRTGYSVFGKVSDVKSENVIDRIKLDDVISRISIISIDNIPYEPDPKNINYIH